MKAVADFLPWQKNKQKLNFAAIGECMIELNHQTATTLNLSYAGDTFNVAYYLACFIEPKKVDVQYITAVGDDPYSEEMLAFLQQAKVGTKHVIRFKNRMPGLYFIRNDEQGERHFYYLRGQSAARDLFKGTHVEQLVNILLAQDYLYLSGISVAILDDASREILLDTLKKARKKGTKIIFDLNYRPALWTDTKTASEVIDQLVNLVDIALPGLSEHQQLFNDKTTEACAKYYHDKGVTEVIVKNGEQGCLVSVAGQENMVVPVTAAKKVLDTTAAGDSYIGSYIAARLNNKTAQQSARFASKVAAKVIQHPGAIIAKQHLPLFK